MYDEFGIFQPWVNPYEDPNYNDGTGVYIPPPYFPSIPVGYESLLISIGGINWGSGGNTTVGPGIGVGVPTIPVGGTIGTPYFGQTEAEKKAAKEKELKEKAAKEKELKEKAPGLTAQGGGTGSKGGEKAKTNQYVVAGFVAGGLLLIGLLIAYRKRRK